MRITVYIKPNSKHDERVVLTEGIYTVRVKAPAVEGKANEAARKLLATHFEVSPSRVTLVSGHTTRHKIFDIELS